MAPANQEPEIIEDPSAEIWRATYTARIKAGDSVSQSIRQADDARVAYQQRFRRPQQSLSTSAVMPNYGPTYNTCSGPVNR